MKIRIWFLSIFAFAFVNLFTACTLPSDSIPSKGNGSDENRESSLVLYVLRYQDGGALDIPSSWFQTAFPGLELTVQEKYYDVAGTFDQMNAELLAGRGPDAVCFLQTEIAESSQFLNALIAQEKFCDLTPVMEQCGFPVENYLDAIFQNSINEKRCTIAYDFYIPMIGTTEERITKYALNITDDMTVSEFSKELDKYLENTSEDMAIFGLDLKFSEFLTKIGENFVDYETRTSSFDSTDFDDVVHCYQKLSSRRGNPTTYSLDYREDPESFLQGKALLYESYYTGVSDCSNAAILNAIIEEQTDETLRVFAYPNMGKRRGTVSLVGGVIEGSAHPEEALKLLVKILEQREDTYWGIARKSRLEQKYSSATKSGPTVSTVYGYEYQALPLPASIGDQIVENTVNAGAFFPDGGINELIDELIGRYLNHELSWEMTIQELSGKVNLYLNE